jgi:hypothetical protein
MPQDRFISSWPWPVTAGIVSTVLLGHCGRFAASGDHEGPGKRTLRSCRIPPGSFACTLAHRSFALYVSTMTHPGSSVNAGQKGNDANQIRD